MHTQMTTSEISNASMIVKACRFPIDEAPMSFGLKLVGLFLAIHRFRRHAKGDAADLTGSEVVRAT